LFYLAAESVILFGERNALLEYRSDRFGEINEGFSFCGEHYLKVDKKYELY